MAMKSYKFFLRMWDGEVKQYGVCTKTVEAQNPASAWAKITGTMNKDMLVNMDTISLIAVDPV